MDKIYPCLWFDSQAEEASRYYTSLFKNSSVNETMYYMDNEHKPEGSILTIDFTIAGQRFLALNGGPEFTFTPAISFWVDCETQAELTALWEAFSQEGQVRMPLQEYPFSEYFGWVEDRYGLSWQLNLAKGPQHITPAIMFANENAGKAKAAMEKWMSLFDDSHVMEEIKVKDLLHQGVFTLAGQTFRVMDVAEKQDFGFTMATSFCVDCDDQAEIDFLWEKLTQGGKEWPCGWAEDAYGVAWQITPANWNELADDSYPERAQAVFKEMYTMKKLDMVKLQRVYDQFSE